MIYGTVIKEDEHSVTLVDAVFNCDTVMVDEIVCYDKSLILDSLDPRAVVITAMLPMERLSVKIGNHDQEMRRRLAEWAHVDLKDVMFVNGYPAVRIDGILTACRFLFANYLKGFSVSLTASDCFVAKSDTDKPVFAHGRDIRSAHRSLLAKLIGGKDIEERINDFVKSHPSWSEKYSASDLFEWHFLLTGSCKFGRDAFCKANHIDMEKDLFTVGEFVDMVRGNYGWEVIKLIPGHYAEHIGCFG